MVSDRDRDKRHYVKHLLLAQILPRLLVVCTVV